MREGEEVEEVRRRGSEEKMPPKKVNKCKGGEYMKEKERKKWTDK